jgi:hypothetical protein
VAAAYRLKSCEPPALEDGAKPCGSGRGFSRDSGATSESGPTGCCAGVFEAPVFNAAGFATVFPAVSFVPGTRRSRVDRPFALGTSATTTRWVVPERDALRSGLGFQDNGDFGALIDFQSAGALMAPTERCLPRGALPGAGHAGGRNVAQVVGTLRKCPARCAGRLQAAQVP